MPGSLFPSNLTFVTLTGRYVDMDGLPIAGKVTFTLPTILTDGAAKTIIVPKTVEAALVDGAFTKDLPACDDPDIDPTNFTIMVNEQFEGATGRQFSITLPSAATSPIDISAIAPVTPPSPPSPSYASLSGLVAEVSDRIAGDAAEATARDAAIAAAIAAIPAVPSATTTVQGIVELATSTEVITGTDTVRAVTPAGLAAKDAATVLDPTAFTDSTLMASYPVGMSTLSFTTTQATTAGWGFGGKAGTIRTYNRPSAAGISQIFNRTHASATTPEMWFRGGDSSGWGAWQQVTPTSRTGTTAQTGLLQLATSSEALTGTSTSKVVTPSGMATFASRNDTGIYVPPGWGQFWKPKRDAAATGKATIACVGSSSTQGLYSSNLITTSWVGKILTSLQTTYGDGGSGYFSTARSAAFMGAAPSTTAWQGTAGNLVTQSGTWNVGNQNGPGANYLYSSINGNFLTFTVRGTTVRIYTMSGAGRVNYTYQIDSGSVVGVTDSGTPQTSVQVTTVTGLSAGTHTVKISHNGSGGSFLSICGVTGENATGIIVNNYGISGAGSAMFAYNTPGTAVANWSGGPDYPADLVIYMLGSNDVLSGMAADSWSSNLRQYLSAVKDGSTVGGSPVSGATDILIAMQHIGTYDNTNFRYHDYIAKGRDIAEAYGAAFVNLWPLGRNSWNYWNSLGYWGNSASVGTAGTDTIHMSDAGHQFTANTLLPILTAA